jgi:hypothetical protein
MMEREVDFVKTVADEILRGPVLSMTEPITHYGIAVVPIIATKNQTLLNSYLETVSRKIPTKMILRTAMYFGFADDRRENENTTGEEKTEIAQKFIAKLPRNTCGIVVLDSDGIVVALNLNLCIQTFWDRTSLLSNLIQKYCNPRGMPIEKKMVLVNTTLFLARLREVHPREIVETKYWGNIMIGLPNFAKETEDSLAAQCFSRSVLYCSIGM